MFSNKDLRRLIIPLIIEQILAVTIGMADTVMVANVGEAAVSGISLVDTVNLLLINIFSALATGGAVVASQYLGRRDRQNACIAAEQLIISIFLFSFFIMIFSLLSRSFLLSFLFGKIEDDVMTNCQIYFLLSAISYPFLALYNGGAALFRAMGNSKISMITSIIMNIINVVGNAIFIFGFRLGVFGAGAATLLSRIVGAIAILLLLKSPHNQLYIISYFKLGFRWKMIKNILCIGVPNGLENGMFQIGKILIQGLIASFGTTVIAANAVGGNIASLQIIPGNAIGLAMITVVGQCVGAKDYTQAKYYTIKLMRLTYLATIAINIVILSLAIPIVNVYNLSATATEIALQFLYLHGISCNLIWPLSFTLPNALRAANDVKFAMTISVFSMWTFRIALSYFLEYVFHLGILGVWIAMIVDWIFRSIAFVLRFIGEKWKTKQLI